MSEDSESLGAILGGSSAFHASESAPKVEPSAEPATEPVKAEVAEPKAQPRDDSGKFSKAEPEAKPTEAKVEPVKADPEKPLTRADVAAIIDERRKRQELERQLQQVQQAPTPPSVFEDEDGAIRARISNETAGLRSALLQQSVRIAQLVHKDTWQDAEQAFYEAAEQNPALVQQFREAVDPGEFVYKHGIFHREMAKYGGDIVAMRDGIRAEANAGLEAANSRIKALEAELAAERQAKADAAAIPKSLNKQTSAPVTAETLTDAEDLSQIVRFGNTG